ncbi:MAG: 50S ribosomal protein L17 [Candidatus Eisenbacteria sp.]|nr:50S ribosomal protein L17 [Candidatus Eisenbacteria bacterium]
MRHGKEGRKLSRTASHRKAMFRNMMASLIREERVKTTEAKAKEGRRWIDKLITLGKRGDLHARRVAGRTVQDKAALKRLFDEIAPRYESRQGGYSRVLKLGPRKGDAAPMALLELVERKVVKAPPAEEGKKKRGKKKTTEEDAGE